MTNIKKVALIMGVLTALGCAPTLKSVSNPKLNSEFYSLSNKFYINNGTDKKQGHNKHYIVEATREEGERGIENLLKQDLEESWLYIKGTTLDGKQVERWYEIGENSTNEEVINIHNPEKIIDDFKEIKEISDYHLHPINKNNLNPYGRDGSDTPSEIDILDFFKTRNTIIYYAKEKGVYNLDFRIITPVGIYSIALPDTINDDEIETLSNYERERIDYIGGEKSLEDILTILRNGGLKVDLIENKSKALNKKKNEK